jgi:hypothetical protein
VSVETGDKSPRDSYGSHVKYETRGEYSSAPHEVGALASRGRGRPRSTPRSGLHNIRGTAERGAPLPAVASPWPSLPVQWRRLLSSGLPALARDIVATIIREIPEYREGPSQAVFAETQHNVNEALQAFVQRLADPGASQRAQSTSELFELFRQLGRNEAIAGRRHDTLQAAYRIASRMIMRKLLEWEREYPIPAERVTELSSSIFDFIDRLADLSAEGYADALGDDPDLARQRARLLELLLDPRGVSHEVVAIRAQQLSWPVPERATLLELDGLDDTYDPPALARLGRSLLDSDALGGQVLGRNLLLSSTEVDAKLLAQRLSQLEPGARVTVGFHVPLDDLVHAHRWIRRLGMLRQVGEIPDANVSVCGDHVLLLVQDAGRHLHQQLIERRLGPLLELSPSKRLKYGRLLSAWLELGSTRASAPGVLDKHRQTLRYQISRLEAMFGAELRDRNARLELILALRAALPRWEDDVRAPLG